MLNQDMININDRFRDNLVAATSLNTELVPALAQVGNSGPIVSPVALDKIAANVYLNVVESEEESSHARPTMLANLSSFCKNVNTALDAITSATPAVSYHKLDDVQKRDFAEWSGMIASIALRNVYSGSGLDISIRNLTLDDHELVHACLMAEMLKDTTYRKAVAVDEEEHPVSGNMFYICQGGSPFAFFHPQLGVCAIKKYREDAFLGCVPWYQDNGNVHENWLPILEPGEPPRIDRFSMRRLAWWANRMGIRRYVDFMERSFGIRVPESPSSSLIANYSNIDQVWEGLGTAFSGAMPFSGSCEKLPNLFIDRLFIACNGGELSALTYNTHAGTVPVSFSKDAQELRGYTPVPPFRAALGDLLDNCSIASLTFEPTVINSNLDTVDVSLALDVEGDTFTLNKRYSYQKMQQGKLPALMVWPYMPLPANQTLWNRFYATWESDDEDVSFLKGTNDSYISPVDTVSFDFLEQGELHQVYRITDDQHPWPVCTGREPFRYAMVTNGTNELGMIFVPAYERYADSQRRPIPNGEPVVLAVDFGTTSTVCGLKHSSVHGGVPTYLPFRSYTRQITCRSGSAEKEMAMYHWLGNDPRTGEHSGKFFSVAQLFSNLEGTAPNRSSAMTAEKQDYYVDCRMFLASTMNMAKYTHREGGNAAHDPLANQQIMNDMKFNDQLNAKNDHAASAFLTGVYLQAVLYLLNEKLVPGNDGSFIDLRISYPNEATLSALKNNWARAYTILSRMMDRQLTEPIRALNASDAARHCFTEAAATSTYLHNPVGSMTSLSAKSCLLSVDIGGGTTDISVSSINHPGEIRKVSMKYAGREIMVDSLIEYYRKFHSGSAIGDSYSCFRQLWPNADNNILDEVRSFTEFGKSADTNDLLNCSKYTSLRMDMELLLASGLNMGKCQVQYSSAILRQLVAIKFMMIMQVAARAVRENLDMWVNPTTKKLSVDNGEIEINLVVSGTSAQMLQYVFDCTMNDLHRLQDVMPYYSDPETGRMMQMRDEILAAVFHQELQEEVEKYPELAGARPALRIFVDARVGEKKEVCFGMLEDGILSQTQTFRFDRGNSSGGLLNGAFSGGLLGQSTAGMGGLLDRTKNALGRTTSMDDQERREKAAAKNLQIRNYPVSDYMYYLANVSEKKYCLLNYLAAYEELYFSNLPKGNLGLGDQVRGVFSLLNSEEFRSHFNKCCGLTAEKRAAYMVEDEQQAYMDLFTNIYITEELLDQMFAVHQSE